MNPGVFMAHLPFAEIIVAWSASMMILGLIIYRSWKK